MNGQDLTWKPLTPETWGDFEELSGEKGLCAGCWCMLWRSRHKDYEAMKGGANKRTMKARVKGGDVPGIMAYLDGDPVAWCSVAPRLDFIRLETSRVLAPVDDTPVWSLTCLFVERKYRRSGFSGFLIQSACEFAKGQGAEMVEAYPIIPKKDKVPDAFSWTGFASVFRDIGFRVVEQRSETRPIMRIDL